MARMVVENVDIVWYNEFKQSLNSTKFALTGK